MKPMRILTPIALVLTLTACEVFEPTYPKDLRKSVLDAQNELVEIMAGVQLGHYTSAGSYKKAEQRYETAIAGFSTAQDWVTRKQASNKPLSTAAALMVTQLNECLTNINLLASTHRKKGLSQSKGWDSTRISCAIATNNILY